MSNDPRKAEFDAIDIDGDGYVTVDEMQKALEAKQFARAEKRAPNLVRLSDKNGDSKLSFEEYAQLMNRAVAIAGSGSDSGSA